MSRSVSYSLNCSSGSQQPGSSCSQHNLHYEDVHRARNRKRPSAQSQYETETSSPTTQEQWHATKDHVSDLGSPWILYFFPSQAFRWDCSPAWHLSVKVEIVSLRKIRFWANHTALEQGIQQIKLLVSHSLVVDVWHPSFVFRKWKGRAILHYLWCLTERRHVFLFPMREEKTGFKFHQNTNEMRSHEAKEKTWIFWGHFCLFL